jgi:hypothetical protein
MPRGKKTENLAGRSLNACGRSQAAWATYTATDSDGGPATLAVTAANIVVTVTYDTESRSSCA